jgi:superfamily II DNA or RNA helicase
VIDASSAGLNHQGILAMCGPEAFARGMVYAREGRVTAVQFEPDSYLLHGRVRGSHRASYATDVVLAGSPLFASDRHRGRCSCPVGVDCKHAAALLLAASTIPELTRLLQGAEWERVLTRLVSAPDIDPGRAAPALGLELEVESPLYRSSVQPLTLRARPIRLGPKGRWLRSGISWEQLDRGGLDYDAACTDLLLQLRAAAGGPARFVYPRSPWMSLLDVSPGFWPFLERSAQAGLTLHAAGEASGSVVVHADRAEVSLDLRRPAGSAGLEISPRLSLAGQPLAAVGIGRLGDPSHGLFWLSDSGGGRELHLAALSRPISGEIGDLLARTARLHVPAADESRFFDDYLPRLRSKASVASSDRSVAIPEPLRPGLSCTVSFRPEHVVRVDWAVTYDTPGGRRSFDPDDLDSARGSRNIPAERRLLESVPLRYDLLPRLAAEPGCHRPAAHLLLAGLEAVDFVAEILPRLEQYEVEVFVVGEPIDYRRVDTVPQIEVSATEDPDRADWFDLHIKVAVDGEVVDFEQLFVALAEGDDALILASGVCIDLNRPQLQVLRDLIVEARSLLDDDRPGQRISKFQASLWDELVQLGVVVEQSDHWVRTVRGLLDVTGVAAVDPPLTLQADLRPYQLDGYRWLCFLYDHGLGGILADDMGLGKTVQALALICRARIRRADEPPFLVVAPTSVVSNWAKEAARFAPGLRVAMIESSQARRPGDLASTAAEADVVVTSYTLLRIDADHYAALDWRGMVLDEAQFVKNHRSKTYQSVRRVRSPFKLAITGTPLENGLMDLWSMLSITAPGLFPHPERFSEFYRHPIERAHDAAMLDRLRRRIRPLVLRRTKESVASDLPPKQEQVVEVVLQPRHQRVYQTHLQRERQKILGLVDELDKNRFTILRSLTLLRQLALDPRLVDEAYATIPASKVDLVVEQLQELVAEGHKALVFSQFTGFLATIRGRLDAAGVDYSYLDGRTRNRGRVVEGFSSGATSVFLISLKAGGFGLNLTEADYCFVLDPWWNPAAESQAVDRAHRIGQTKSVMVYRLVAKDTIEEKVMELKARKDELFAAVMGGDALASTSLGVDDIRSLVAG